MKLLDYSGLGKSLENNKLGIRWISKARRILWEQIKRQINPDGSNREQSFWYLGFVIDALLHYVLLEEREKIPTGIRHRIEKALEFTHDMILPDGLFPDYGDRDDGVVFRLNGHYEKSPFPGLLNTGALLFDRPEWSGDHSAGAERLNFWKGHQRYGKELQSLSTKPSSFDKPQIKTYPHGGMTLMQWAKGLSAIPACALRAGEHLRARSCRCPFDNLFLGKYSGFDRFGEWTV